MTDDERDELISKMTTCYDLSNKYADYVAACERALLSLRAASGGASFMYDKQTPNVCRKVNKGIHPNQELLNRMCLNRHELDTEIDNIIGIIEQIHIDALTKSLDYESKAVSIMNQLQWG